MKVITTAVIKGGTGKSTTCTALAQCAAKKGYKVLVIDLDPQANTSRFTGAQLTKGAFEWMTGAESAEQCIQHTEQGLAVISASMNLASLETTKGSANLLPNAIKGLKEDFDFVFVDTPPQLGTLTLTAISAADALLIPLETDAGSVFGLDQVDYLADLVKKKKRLSFLGILITRFDPRPKVNKALRDAIQGRAKEQGAEFLGCIRNGIAVREAQALRTSLFEYAKKSNPAKDYQALFEKLISQL